MATVSGQQSSNNSRVVIDRGQIGKAKGLDVTVKSAQGWARAFAPTWEMVLQLKNGMLSEAEYRDLYVAQLERIKIETWRELWRYGKRNGGTVKLLCYCRDGEFCHTYLIGAYVMGRDDLSKGFELSAHVKEEMGWS